MNITLQEPKQFLADFLRSTKYAKKSIYLQSMNFESGKVMEQIADVLISKAHQGLDVRIHVDWVAQLYVHGRLRILPPLFPRDREYANKIHNENNILRENLTESGVKIVTTNTPVPYIRLLPLLKRNHIKLYFVDGKISWMGGINLLDRGFENIDFMVKFTDPAIIKVFLGQFMSINDHRPQDDYAIEIDQENTLFIDCGKYARSIIYRTALDEIDNAKEEIFFMSQFVPDGSLLAALVKASERGVKIHIITSPSTDRKFVRYPDKLVYDYFKVSIQSKRNIYFAHLQSRVHAKLIFIDGRKALFGSHNYSYFGVLFGTEEIMLRSYDRDLVAQIKGFLAKNAQR